MVLKCVFCGEKSEQEVRSLHKLPKCPEQRTSWVQNMKIENFVPTNTMRLCSDHFKKDCFQEGGNYVKLQPGSIPTLFSTYKSSCAYCNVTKKECVENRSFHKFPLHDKELLRSWLARMGMEGFVPSKRSILCSDHFEKSCFSRRGNIRLKSDAVPTIFIPETRKGEKRSHSPLHSTPVKYLKTDSEVNSRKSLNLEEDCSSRNAFIQEKNLDVPTTVVNTAFCITEDTPEITEKLVNESAQWRNHASTSKIVQLDHGYESTSRTSEKKLKMVQAKLRMIKANLKNKDRKIFRLKKKVSSLNDIVSKLRKTRAFPESGLACLDSIADSGVSEFLQRFERNAKQSKAYQSDGKKSFFKEQRKKAGYRNENKSNISREEYSPALRSFAVTLYIHSPKTYGFVRRKFCNALPDPSTLRSWYSSIDGEPGFTVESSQALSVKISEAQKAKKHI